MLLVIDVHYRDDNSAVVAGLTFNEWSSDEVEGKHIVKIDNVEPYEPGSFYKRELPCILALLNSLEKVPNVIVIDGYVTLGKENEDGLGAHLYKALNPHTPIIGVAKSRFSGTSSDFEVYRGQSKQPLFVTSAGIDNSIAKELIKSMHGNNRLPTLLKAVDRECRDAIT
ncbi:endonuclease V [Photobacterium sagamiensis]|uniref:endonuclease V n=1 Tax=Photobacterium sagamiensis TaxID=2910241 RepID=UPI003D0D61A1